MVRVDALIVGGGLQGLLVLDRLVAGGHSCALVSPTDLGHGQTLHAHGVFNTGFGFAGPMLRDRRDRLAVPFLRACGIEPYGEWFLLSPTDEPVGEAASADSLPAGFDTGGAFVRRLPELNFPKRRVVEVLGRRHRDRILRGRIGGWRGEAAIDRIEVRAEAAAEPVVFAPTMVVAATGTGTKRFISELAGGGPGLEKIRHRRVEMLCVDGPAGLLPEASVLSLQGGLNLVAHRAGERVRWYSTPWQDEDPHHEDVPDDAQAMPDPDVAADGFRRLAGLFPPLETHPEFRFTAYAGYRQDIGEIVGTPACELVPGLDNLLMLLPSLAVNAWQNAVEAVAMADEHGRLPQPEIPHGGVGVRIGRQPEDRAGARWWAWSELDRLAAGDRRC